MDTNQEELQIKVVFSSLCQGKCKGLGIEMLFCTLFLLLLLLFCYLTSAKIQINNQTDLKSQSLPLD